MKVDTAKMDLLMARQQLLCVDLARLAGIAPTTLNYMRMAGSCKPKTLGQVSNALGVDPAELLK